MYIKEIEISLIRRVTSREKLTRARDSNESSARKNVLRLIRIKFIYYSRDRPKFLTASRKNPISVSATS